MALPISVIMDFSAGPGKRITEKFAYYDTIVFGFGNWFPMLTFVLSIIILCTIIWILLGHRKSKTNDKFLLQCSTTCTITSLLSLFFYSHISIPGTIIFIINLVPTIFLYFLYFIYFEKI